MFGRVLNTHLNTDLVTNIFSCPRNSSKVFPALGKITCMFAIPCSRITSKKLALVLTKLSPNRVTTNIPLSTNQMFNHYLHPMIALLKILLLPPPRRDLLSVRLIRRHLLSRGKNELTSFLIYWVMISKQKFQFDDKPQKKLNITGTGVQA